MTLGSEEFGNFFGGFRVCLIASLCEDEVFGHQETVCVKFGELGVKEMTSPLSRSSSRSTASSEETGSARVKASAAEKFIDLKASAEETMTRASARLSEKVVLVRTNLALGLRRIIHHEHSPRHDKCLDYVADVQTAATERRLRKEQEARERAEWERDVAREWSAYKSSQHRKASALQKHLQNESRSHLHLVQGAA